MNSRRVALTANVQSRVRIDQPYMWAAIVVAGGDISLVNGVGQEFLDLPARSVLPFEKQIKGDIRLTSTLTETVTIAWGDTLADMPRLPGMDTTGGSSAASVKGQLAEGTAVTDPNDATLFPFVGGTRNRNIDAIRATESVAVQQFIASVSDNIAPLLVAPTRNDFFSNIPIAPNTATGQDVQSDHAMVTVSLTGTAADVLDTLFQISDSANVTPTVYNMQTGLPTAVAGRMVVPGQYFFFIEGASRVSFSAPVANAAAVNVWASASSACRPRLEPMYALGSDGLTKASAANPFPAQLSQGNAVASATNPIPVSLESKLATYAGGIQKMTVALTATDIFTINAHATKTVKLKYLEISHEGANNFHFALLKRSTLDTTGTFTNPTSVPYVTGDPASGVTLTAYTANPGALGALVGMFGSKALMTPNTVPAIFDFSNRNAKCPTLTAGSTEQLAINCGGLNAAANTVSIYCEWTEE